MWILMWQKVMEAIIVITIKAERQATIKTRLVLRSCKALSKKS